MAAPGEILLNTGLSVGQTVELTGGAFNALLLWRPRPGEAVTVTGPNRRLYRARVEALGAETSTLTVFEEAGTLVWPEITLLQALPEKERMELVIEKTTELGVTRIVPFKSERSTSLEELDFPQKKSHRWAERALKASRQCRRPTVAEVTPYCSFVEALGSAPKAGLKLVLWEGPGLKGIKEVLRGSAGEKSVVVLVGPEGGLTEAEVERAEKSGFIPVTLGSLVLRTETAALAAVCIVRYEFGDTE